MIKLVLLLKFGCLFNEFVCLFVVVFFFWVLYIVLIATVLSLIGRGGGGFRGRSDGGGGRGRGQGGGGRDGGGGPGGRHGGGGGGKGHAGGMKGGSKVIVVPFRHDGVFVAKGKEDAL